MKITKFIIVLLHLILLLFISEIHTITSNLLRITLPNNSILIGRYATTQNGNGIRAFMGIPYAKPPIGNLRFKSPVPITPWRNEKHVTTDASYCMQSTESKKANVLESEDCLYLNVYTPLNINESLAVMVFFHGGALETGTGMGLEYGPDYLLEKDIIFVAANYRLGALGFLSTGQEDCPGNFGLKDQLLVLKWIQENIVVFGGDQSKITIFGESAGGTSVTLLMMSPLSKGLFHKAISQSGTNFSRRTRPISSDVAKKRALKVGELVHCPIINDNWKNFVNCLRNKSATDIIETYKTFRMWKIDPMVAFPPVVELPKDENAFITEYPKDVNQFHGNSIPFLIGMNHDEGLEKSVHILENSQLKLDIDENWNRILPIILFYNQYPENIKTIVTNKIMNFYFKNNTDLLNKYTFDNFTKANTDAWIVCGVDGYIKKRLSTPTNSTYIYLFSHKGEASYTELWNNGKSNKNYGVCHFDELLYLFPYIKTHFKTTIPTKSDLQMRNILIELWTNFAKTGNPTPSYSNLPTWRSANGYPLDYLRIGNTYEPNKTIIGMEKGLWEDRVNFWRELQLLFIP